MAGWLEGISINETSQHNFYNMAGLRLLPCYVNSLFLSFYCAMLHNHNLRGIDGLDVITAFRQWAIIEGFLRES